MQYTQDDLVKGYWEFGLDIQEMSEAFGIPASIIRTIVYASREERKRWPFVFPQNRVHAR